MSRLYEISYNENQWSVKGNRNSGYKLVNRATLDVFSISGDVIGIGQISDDTFLVYRHVMLDKWEIVRLNLSGDKPSVEYKHKFNHFHFLTDDLIIFNYEHYSTGAQLYSISKNCEIDDLNHLISGTSERHDASYVSNRNITLLYEKGKYEYPIYLLVDYKLKNTFRTNEHLQLILDPNSLQPVTPVYSTLRNKYFTLSESLTLRDIVEEENHYLYIIDNFLYNFYQKDNTKDAEELLSMVQKTE